MSEDQTGEADSVVKGIDVPREDVEMIVDCARELIEQHERRSPTSKNATLGELDALFALKLAIRGRTAHW